MKKVSETMQNFILEQFGFDPRSYELVDINVKPIEKDIVIEDGKIIIDFNDKSSSEIRITIKDGKIVRVKEDFLAK